VTPAARVCERLDLQGASLSIRLYYEIAMNKSDVIRPESAAQQLAGFIAKFDPEVAKLIRSARVALRKRLPTAYELVYDNYNFLAIGFSSTERTSDCIVSLASYAKGVSLFFYYGAKLADPHKLLQGGGKQVRFIRLESAATLAKPEVEALLRAATAQGKTALSRTGSGRGRLLVKSISARQRPRRTGSK
jgi:hypothetical protein